MVAIWRTQIVNRAQSLYFEWRRNIGSYSVESNNRMSNAYPCDSRDGVHTDRKIASHLLTSLLLRFKLLPHLFFFYNNFQKTREVDKKSHSSWMSTQQQWINVLPKPCASFNAVNGLICVHPHLTDIIHPSHKSKYLKVRRL